MLLHAWVVCGIVRCSSCRDEARQSCAVFWRGLAPRRHRSLDWRRSFCPYFLWTVISMPIITLNDRLSWWKDTRLWGLLSLCSYWLIDDERWCEFQTLVTAWWPYRAPVGILCNTWCHRLRGVRISAVRCGFLNCLSWILIAVNWRLVGQVLDESTTVSHLPVFGQVQGKGIFCVVCF